MGKFKPKPKTEYSKPVSVYDLETGEWTSYKSIALAARSIDVSHATVNISMKQNKPAKQRWVIVYQGEESKVSQSLAYLQDHYNSQVRAITKKESRNRKVQLRIDRHTIIYVDPENATEEYAEKYRQRLARKQKLHNE